MLHIPNLEEIEGILLRVPGLIERLEGHDPAFGGAVTEWLKEAEQALTNNRLTAAATVATLRGMLISAERGVLPPERCADGRAPSRKVKDAYAADLLRTAEGHVASAISAPAAQIAEAERLTRQLVTLARRKGLIPPETGGGSLSERLNDIWQRMMADPELAGATSHVAGLVGNQDSLILLDRALAT
jgi:hypothetical protein